MGEEQGNVAEAIKILVADHIAQEGIDLLRTQLPGAQIDIRYGLKPEQPRELIGDYTALVVRSESQVTGEILALARHTPTTNNTLKTGKWEKNRFLGLEVRNKVLGIIGLGKVGTEVARRAQGLEMQVIAFDPYVAP